MWQAIFLIPFEWNLVRLAYLGKECNTKRISQRKLVVAIILMTSNCFAAHLFLQSIASDGVTGNVFCVPSIDLLQCDFVWGFFFIIFVIGTVFVFHVAHQLSNDWNLLLPENLFFRRNFSFLCFICCSKRVFCCFFFIGRWNGNKWWNDLSFKFCDTP